MGKIDANGVWIYDENDRRSPFSAALNLAQDAQSAALAALAGRIKAAQGDLTDRMPLRAFTTDTARDAFWGSPTTQAGQLALQTAGPLAIRADMGGLVETYLAPYNPDTNPQGATPAGWYILPGTIFGSARRLFTGTVLLPAGASAIQSGTPGSGAWALTAVVPATPILLELGIELGNPNSGAHQSVSVRAFEDTTALASAKSYPLPLISGAATLETRTLSFTFTPAAGKHTYTVQLTPTTAGGVHYRDATLQLSSIIPRA